MPVKRYSRQHYRLNWCFITVSGFHLCNVFLLFSPTVLFGGRGPGIGECIMLDYLPMEANHVVGIKISGKIKLQDLERLIVIMEKKLDQHERINVYVEVESFGGVSLAALVEDLKFVRRNFKRFARKAVVSEMKWMGTWTAAADHLFPSLEMSHFLPEQIETVLKWIQEEMET